MIKSNKIETMFLDIFKVEPHQSPYYIRSIEFCKIKIRADFELYNNSFNTHSYSFFGNLHIHVVSSLNFPVTYTDIHAQAHMRFAVLNILRPKLKF